MHIEPGVVDGAKMDLACVTAADGAGYAAKLAVDDLKSHNIASFGLCSAIAALGTFLFFEVLPHFPVGNSEVHFIPGTTLFLLMGAAPAALCLAIGLLVQGLFFAPTDLAMYFVNVTSLLAPLLVIAGAARRVIPAETAYVDLGYGDVLKLSVVYQGGVVGWGAFWAFYGQGVGAETFQSVWTFALAYMLVVLIEPLADLGALASAKALRWLENSGAVTRRLYSAA